MYITLAWVLLIFVFLMPSTCLTQGVKWIDFTYYDPAKINATNLQQVVKSINSHHFLETILKLYFTYIDTHNYNQNKLNYLRPLSMLTEYKPKTCPFILHVDIYLYYLPSWWVCPGGKGLSFTFLWNNS